MSVIVGVRFQKLGKIYHFDAGSYAETVKPGDYVLVTTSRGKQIGQIINFVTEGQPTEGDRRPIDRPASAQDLIIQQSWKEREEETLSVVRERAQALRIKGVRFHSAVFGFDGSQLTILYSTDTDEKLDLRPLRNDLGQRFTHHQIELRQVGPRDVARLLCGLGACGLQERCCSKFLCEFSPISIKMAKAQGISLNPGEITGMCGRLRCCLIYEYDQYAEARQRLPKRGKRVQTPRGPGRVAEVFPLRDGVLVDLGEEMGTAEFRREEIQLLDDQTPAAPNPPEPRPNPSDGRRPNRSSNGERGSRK
jgi:cell fate regulator YaaT (PSP1 superfamily)